MDDLVWDGVNSVPNESGPVRRSDAGVTDRPDWPSGGRGQAFDWDQVSRTFSMINIVSTVTSRPSTLSATALTAWL